MKVSKISEALYKNEIVEDLYNKITKVIEPKTWVRDTFRVRIGQYGISDIVIGQCKEVGWNGFFDAIKSHKTIDGKWIIFIYMKKIEPHTLFHELHHALQWIKTDGKSHDLFNDFNDVYYCMYSNSSENIRLFMDQIIYYLTPKESEAHVAELSYMIQKDPKNKRIEYLFDVYFKVIYFVRNETINFNRQERTKLDKVFQAIDMEKSSKYKLKHIDDEEGDERREEYLKASPKGTEYFSRKERELRNYLIYRSHIVERKLRRLQSEWIKNIKTI